jgi:hypothetical protein
MRPSSSPTKNRLVSGWAVIGRPRPVLEYKVSVISTLRPVIVLAFASVLTCSAGAADLGRQVLIGKWDNL